MAITTLAPARQQLHLREHLIPFGPRVNEIEGIHETQHRWRQSKDIHLRGGAWQTLIRRPVECGKTIQLRPWRVALEQYELSPPKYRWITLTLIIATQLTLNL